MFVDGNLINQAPATGIIADTSESIYIGSRKGTSYFFNGYLDDIRITKGLARWTSNFTPPTAPAAVGQVDSMIDSPTNNFAVLDRSDPIMHDVLSNGNLQLTSSHAGQGASRYGSLGVSSGKWYFEAQPLVASTGLNYAF